MGLFTNNKNYDGSWSRPLHGGPDPVRYEDQAEYNDDLAAKLQREGKTSLAKSARERAKAYRKAYARRQGRS